MLKSIKNHQTLPEAQRTQGIDFKPWVNLSARILQNQFQLHYFNWLQIWSPNGTTCISSKFGHQMVPLALVPNSSKVVHQIESLALPHCLGLFYWLFSVSIKLVAWSARVSSVKFQKLYLLFKSNTGVKVKL